MEPQTTIAHKVRNILRDRGNEYGDSLRVSADLLNAGLEDRVMTLDRSDIAVILALIKVSRVVGHKIQNGEAEMSDTLNDLMGYLILALQK